MLLCAMAAGALAAFAPISQELSGRDFRLPGTIMAGLMFATAAILRSHRRWPAIDLLASLVLAEAFALCLTGLFSGLTGLHLLDPFNLRWLGSVSPFIVFPWLAGALLGGFLRKGRSR